MTNEQKRHEWVRAQLKKLPAGSRLLDAGAGEKPYRKYCDHLDYVSQDFAQYEPDPLRGGLQMTSWDHGELDIVSDIVAIPEPDGSFDAILCSEVLEHVPDAVKVIGELARLLRSGGRLILTAPFNSLTHFAPYHFSTGFSRYFYEHHLPACGLTIEELSHNGNYFDFLVQELRRIDHVAMQYADDRPSWLESKALIKVQEMAEAFSESGEPSSELLCFGWHVVAVKA
jgi:ubiquinone/menaquinone biosynthesis C-methylase UbiE